jgi:hypothetical protein
MSLRFTSSSDGPGPALAARIANGGQWQRELEALIGRQIELEWLDADDATRSASGALLYERARYP